MTRSTRPWTRISVPAFDSNVLVYAANADSEFHTPCHEALEQARLELFPSFLTWNVCYEFLRVTTHQRTFPKPWTSLQSWRFLVRLLDSPGFQILYETDRHGVTLAKTLAEFPELRGSKLFDLHTAVILRENGIKEIYTRDADFHRFPFLTVLDPLQPIVPMLGPMQSLP